MQADTVQLSATVLVWIGGVLVALVGGIGTICAHILLRIHGDLKDMRTDFAASDKKSAVKEVEVEARMRVLERHDQRNTSELQALRSYERGILAANEAKG